MGLQAADAVDHVGARILEPSGPADVRGLVEARGQFDHHRHLLSALRRGHERLHHLRVGSGTIEGLLDGEDLGVGRGLLDEVEDGLERLVGMVKEHIATGEHGEEIRRVGGNQAQLRPLARVAVGIENGKIENLEEQSQVEGAADAVDERLGPGKSRHELREQGFRDLRVDVEPDHLRPATAADLVLHLGQEVVAAAFIVDVEFGVPQHAERGHVAHGLSGEERRELREHDGFESDVRGVCAGHPHKTGQGRRHRNHPEPRLPSLLFRVGLEKHREVDRERGQHRKRACRIDAEGGDDGEDFVLEETNHARAQGDVEVREIENPDPDARKARQDVALGDLVQPLQLQRRHLLDHRKLLGGRETGGVGRGVALGNRVLQ